MTKTDLPAGIEPAVVWQHFDILRRVPRCSGHEGPVRDAVLAWADAQGFERETDAVGNVLVRVPATAGREGEPPTALQGHLDMVCEKNADVDHDFAAQGIELAREGDWLTAVGTTLGADNGLGVATAMALAVDPEASHGPLELLFTIDEERGLTGASNLQPGWVTAPTLLNLDTEEEGSIYIGCAGGGDVRSLLPLEREPVPEGWLAYSIEVKGLTGGHSGLDIDKNRANAIKCLARTLDMARRAGVDYRPAKVSGGTMRNAIPREARVGGSIKPAEVGYLEAVVKAAQEELGGEFSATDPNLEVLLTARPDCGHETVFSASFTARLTDALLATPSSVTAMSQDVPGLVETSTNLGVVRTHDTHLEVVNCTRSSKGVALEALRHQIAAVYRLAGGENIYEDSYPGWQPDPDAELLKAALEIHREAVGREAEVKAVHAGLECGLIGEVYPGTEMISVGPTVLGAHSPDERVSISSVGVFYDYVKALLAPR